MLSSLFDSSTIPVLEQVVSFTQARHGVLAGNIANIDTPGYKTRDLSPVEFQKRLKEAIDDLHEPATSPGYATYTDSSEDKSIAGQRGMDRVRDSMKDILYHDQSDVSLEQQVAEISKNQAQHNMAISLMTSQFRLLQVAISERA